MTTRSNRTQTPPGGLRWLVPLSLSLALAVSAAAAPCSSKTYELNVPDAATLQLKDGDHVIAKLTTDRGPFEVHVHVSGKSISDHEFWVNGKRLREGKESDLKPEVLKCLKAQNASLPTAEDWIAAAARVASNLVEHTAEAAKSGVLTVTATCYEYAAGKYFCAYRVCYGTACHIEFDD
ncbi:MAG: hypothetical protein ACHQM4_02085 [Thermoanaerobaculia bacterium]